MRFAKNLSFFWPLGIFLAVLLLRYVLLSQPAPGLHIYEAHCQNCHQPNGVGLKALIPPLANSDYLTSHVEDIPCIIRYGQQGPIVVNGRAFNHPMPGNEELTLNEITTLINFLNQSWGNQIETVTIKEVKNRLDNCSVKGDQIEGASL